MHRHLSTGSATLAALMALQTHAHAAAPAGATTAGSLDIIQLLASMGEHGQRATARDEAARPG